MSKRVLISHQGCIPIYRKGFFEALAALKNCQYVVASGNSPKGTHYILAEPPFAFSVLTTRNIQFTAFGKNLVWQTLVKKFLTEFDAAVLGDESKYLSSAAIILLAKILGRPVVLWGFGVVDGIYVDLPRGPVGRLANWLALAVQRLRLKLADGYLAYTEQGAEGLAKLGVPEDRIRVLRNTVDIEHLRRLRSLVLEETEGQRRKALGISSTGPILVFFGRLLKEKKVECLIDYASQSRDPSVHIVIFGEGPEKVSLMKLAAQNARVTFHAPDDKMLAYALSIAEATVIPGLVGLAITHSFAFGLPMIARAGIHSPEISYLQHGVNGLYARETDEDFFRSIDAFLADAALRQRLRQGADNSAKQLSVYHMAREFDQLLSGLLQKKS